MDVTRELDQIRADLACLRDFASKRSHSIWEDGEAYEVYHRWGFLDPQRDNPQAAIAALELREYELTDHS